MRIELKPCPFCGREPAVADIIGGDHACWVDCYQCETSGPVVVGGDLSNAADAWNSRQSDAATARAEAAEQRAEAVVADAQAAAHFAQSVAHLLAPPGAEAAAVQHLRASDLPHLLDCLRERLAEQRVEAQPAEVPNG